MQQKETSIKGSLEIFEPEKTFEYGMVREFILKHPLLFRDNAWTYEQIIVKLLLNYKKNFKKMEKGKTVDVKEVPNGPILVTYDNAGVKTTTALCRCGLTNNEEGKCDGNHIKKMG